MLTSPIAPNPGIVGLFLKLGRVNPGFWGSNCLGRIGVVLFAGEFPSPNEGPVTEEEAEIIIRECMHLSTAR